MKEQAEKLTAWLIEWFQLKPAKVDEWPTVTYKLQAARGCCLHPPVCVLARQRRRHAKIAKALALLKGGK